MADDLVTVRLDKWLWAARFYKTRSLATEAINGGKVHVNGQRCKPAKEIKLDTEIEIHKNGYIWQLTVIALNTQRRSAKDAALLYEESAESHAKRQEQIIAEKEQKALLGFSPGNHKPNKKNAG